MEQLRYEVPAAIRSWLDLGLAVYRTWPVGAPHVFARLVGVQQGVVECISDQLSARGQSQFLLDVGAMGLDCAD